MTPGVGDLKSQISDFKFHRSNFISRLSRMPLPFINRELSWLEFNQRVLNEALRDDLPLLERVKFLGDHRLESG